jgi:N-formylglutamate amidohydrolase
MEDAFFCSATGRPITPVLLSVPHAGRHYPGALEDLARLSADQLTVLEDRFADRLIERAIESGHGAITARVARAWIDLNRGEDELDPAMIAGQRSRQNAPHLSAKVRGGLGLIPARIAQGGDIWKAPLEPHDIDFRTQSVYRPYHHAIAKGLAERRALFGCAVLLDVHSMPSLKADRNGPPPHIVVGDLHGRSASPCFSDVILAEARGAGFRVTRNAPYAGAHILERHSSPLDGIHALQLEVDRSLYLCSQARAVGPGLPALQNLIVRLAEALAREAMAQSFSVAAE